MLRPLIPHDFPVAHSQQAVTDSRHRFTSVGLDQNAAGRGVVAMYDLTASLRR